MRFAGRLDRVDETPLGARIIDYKTGGGGTERSRIKERLGVQLPVYQLAWRQAGGQEYETSPACTGSSRAAAASRTSTCRRAKRRPRAGCASSSRGAVDLVDAGMFPRTTRQRCEYCDVRYACGVSGWARARKREHEAARRGLRAAVARRRGGRGWR